MDVQRHIHILQSALKELRRNECHPVFTERCERYAALRSQSPLLDIVVVTLLLRKLFLHER